MLDNLALWQDEALQHIAAADTLPALDAARVAFTGKKSPFADAMKALGTLPPDQRGARGQQLNACKALLTQAIDARAQVLADIALEQTLAQQRADMTLPAYTAPQGSIHPVAQVWYEVASYFAAQGFSQHSGPDIETEENNFDKLNIGATHPARGMHDTFYLQDHSLLRTHTSPVQVRAMQTHGAPLRLIAPGRTYRRDSDATHTPMFHQCEGLVIEPAAHLGHLKHVLMEFFRFFFQDNTLQVLFRTSYFPFTEPSFEVDIVRNGRVLEVAGAGIIHPQVLTNCGLNPQQHGGFAWGMGLDRLAMLKYNINDLRSLFDGDMRRCLHDNLLPTHSLEAL